MCPPNTWYLHLDGIPVLEGLVQDPGGVYDLPAQVLVVSVSHVQGLGRERIRLHFHVSPRDTVHERGLAHIGEPGCGGTVIVLCILHNRKSLYGNINLIRRML